MAKKDDFYYAVRRQLDELGMEQQELAAPLGITPAFVSSILNGKCGKKSRLKYIPQIAKILNISELPEDVRRAQLACNSVA